MPTPSSLLCSLPTKPGTKYSRKNNGVVHFEENVLCNDSCNILQFYLCHSSGWLTCSTIAKARWTPVTDGTLTHILHTVALKPPDLCPTGNLWINKPNIKTSWSLQWLWFPVVHSHKMPVNKENWQISRPTYIEFCVGFKSVNIFRGAFVYIVMHFSLTVSPWVSHWLPTLCAECI